MARTLLSRLRALRDRILLPEATSGTDQWQRVALIEAVDRYIAALDPPTRSAAEISGKAHAARPWKRFVSLDYPEFDLCAPLGDRGPFDVVICEQVLEHVADPFAAAANLRGLCAPGGHVIVSTPFLVRVHELPLYGLHDYWRFTPRGLRSLLERAGLEVESVGSWGNRSCAVGNFDRWPAYRWWHSLRNEPDLPVQVWAFARNPG
ncbi:MAG TPA: methyltransferase domain-containing protein [Myxococcota bacterium]|nr:methyltransferase domain-containing protein [Myxococcota bacterium]